MTANQQSWLFNPTPGKPVRVKEPETTKTAAQFKPVQEYEDRWDNYQVRVIRYAGQCHGCTRPLWAHDDGRESALVWEANSVLEAAEYGKNGPTVMLCLECANDRRRHEAALAAGQELWIARR